MYGGVSCRCVPVFGSNEVPDPVRALYTPITHDRVLQIQNSFNTLYICWAKTMGEKISQFRLCMEVSTVFGYNEVPDPVRALFAPITHDRVLQIQNGFNILYIYWAKTIGKKSINSVCMYVWRCEL